MADEDADQQSPNVTDDEQREKDDAAAARIGLPHYSPSELAEKNDELRAATGGYTPVVAPPSSVAVANAPVATVLASPENAPGKPLTNATDDRQQPVVAPPSSRAAAPAVTPATAPTLRGLGDETELPTVAPPGRPLAGASGASVIPHEGQGIVAPPPPNRQQTGNRHPAVPAITGLFTKASNIGNPFVRVLAKLATGILYGGEAVGESLAPGVAMNIPGSILNARRTNLENQRQENTEASLAIEQKNADTARMAALDKEQPRQPLNEQVVAAQQRIDTAAAAGQQPDPNDVGLVKANAEVTSGNAVSRAAAQAPKFQYAKDGTPMSITTGGKTYSQSNIANAPDDVQQQWQQAQDALNTTKAGVQAAVKKYGLLSLKNPPPDPSKYKQGASDPQYGKDVSAWAKEIDDGYNQEQTRLAAARGSAYQQNRPVNVVMPDGTLRVVSAGRAEAEGLTPAAQGVQAMGRNAQIEDIYAGLQTMEGVLNENGVLKWNPGQVGYMQSAFRSDDPGAAAAAWQSLVKSGLSPEQMDFVVAMQQLDERIMSLRNVAGMGAGSDQLREAILRTVPGITTGTPALARKQLDALTNEVDNLSMGIPQTPLNKNPQIRNRENTQGGGKPPKGAAFTAKGSDGKTHWLDKSHKDLGVVQ